MKNLIIVESPAKAKTIKKVLGKNYDVVASMGHVRDLPKSRMGVDIENDFEPDYISMRDKSKVIKELKAAAKGKDNVYLAPDPDREGEAIAWHLAHLLKLDLSEPIRVTFNEITKAGIKHGMDNPRHINQELVDAQQARRVLDRLVGYQLSPFLWKKVRRGLSAGRVQSVTLSMIMNREKAIRDFISEEYWSIEADLLGKSSKSSFKSLYYGSPKKTKLEKKKDTDKILKDVGTGEFKVMSVKQGKRVRKAPAPFITSTLQQDASRKFGFQARRTMMAAQNLYEGINLPEMGSVGLITYMRTDSRRISDEAYFASKDYIEKNYGKEYLPPKRRTYKGKKGEQDGHEAIRPTDITLTPATVKASLSADQFKLYDLVWKRFVASQMADTMLDTVSADIAADKHIFRSSGFSVAFDGFSVLYTESADEEEEQSKMLPKLKEGEILKLKDIKGNQHFTQPPGRFTEASLIKELEENGIGRPSTYAPTISTITSRGYVEREGRALVPTELGEIVNGLMEEQFPDVVNVEFTAKMEDELDLIEDSKTHWKKVVKEFYDPFEENLKQAEINMEGKRIDIPDEETDEICDKCGKPMVIKAGRFGKFIACTGFPECKNTKTIVKPAVGSCPKCGSALIVKKTRKGRTFYGCESYPDCDFASWNAPIKENCPQCASTLFKTSKKKICMKEGCGYEKDNK